MRVVVAGAGETGRHLAGILSRRGDDVVLVERDSRALSLVQDELDVMTVLGDVTRRSVLRQAEVDRADGFVAVTDTGATNIVSAALAASMGAGRAICRVEDSAFLDGPGGVEEGVLGLDLLLCPARLAVAELARMLDRIDAIAAWSFGGFTIRVALLEITSRSPGLGRPAADLSGIDGAAVCAVIRDGEVRTPAEIARLEHDDKVVLVGDPTAVSRARERWVQPPVEHHFVVVGAGETGIQLARRIQRAGTRVTVIDRAPACASAAAIELPDCTVMQGDGTSMPFLRDIGLDHAEAVVAVTGHDETNLMVSLLARQLGVPHTFIEVHRPGYTDLYHELGIEGTVANHDVLARTAVQALAPTAITQVQRIPDTGFSIVEYQLGGLPNRAGARWTVADLPLEAPTVVLAIERGLRALLATPDLPILAGDSLILAHPTRRVDWGDSAT